jgi:hypothetical protein
MRNGKIKRKDPESDWRGDIMFNSKSRFVPAIALVSIWIASCQTAIAPTPTSTFVPPPTVMPTATSTPDVAATQQYESFFPLIKTYFDAGYLHTENGVYRKLKDFDDQWAEVNNLKWWAFDFNVASFALKARFKWESAVQDANFSGCGIVFGGQDNSYYAVFLDTKRVYLHIPDETQLRELGRVDFPNPAEADFTLIVNDATDKLFVLVNDELIGEGALDANRSMEGFFGYTILSGTDKDFGTRCEATSVSLWTFR